MRAKVTTGLTRYPSRLAGGFFILLYYIPIYFQAVRNTSATESGIRNLALIIADSMFPSSVAPPSRIRTHSSFLLSIDGHHLWHRYHTLRLLCPLRHNRRRHHHNRLRLAIHLHHDILQRRLDRLPDPCRLGDWVLLPGSNHGRASAFSTGRCVINYSDLTLSVPSLTTDTFQILLLIIFVVAQTIGGAIFVSAGQSAFSNQFIKSLIRNVPELDPAQAITVGASSLRSVYHGAQLAGVIASYMDGIKVAFALSIGLAGLATVVSVTVPWVSVKGKAEFTAG